MPTSGRRETKARDIQGLFKVVTNTTASIANGATVSATPPTTDAGKVINAFIQTGSVRGSGLGINTATLTSGEVTAVEVFNAATAQTATVGWVLAGNF